jgi:calcineurin-like phosphoesterase family protein
MGTGTSSSPLTPNLRVTGGSGAALDLPEEAGGMTHFVIGCTHFGHANIIGLASRPFPEVEAMDAALLERWNARVSVHDTVFHLGDFGWSALAREWARERLNGKIVTLQGNHDPKGWGRPYLEIEEAGKTVVLFHYPISDWNGRYRGAIHVHAHTHSHELSDMPGRFNACVEATGYAPVDLAELVQRSER